MFAACVCLFLTLSQEVIDNMLSDWSLKMQQELAGLRIYSIQTLKNNKVIKGEGGWGRYIKITHNPMTEG